MEGTSRRVERERVGRKAESYRDGGDTSYPASDLTSVAWSYMPLESTIGQQVLGYNGVESSAYEAPLGLLIKAQNLGL